MSSKRKSKVEQEKRKILLKSILDQWVCIKRNVDGEDRFIYIKHRLRDKNSHSKIEQIILSDDPVESGVYYITDYNIERVLDFARNAEMIEIVPFRFDQEVGILSEKNRLPGHNELIDYLLENDYVTEDEVKKFSDFDNKPPGIDEISLG